MTLSHKYCREGGRERGGDHRVQYIRVQPICFSQVAECNFKQFANNGVASEAYGEKRRTKKKTKKTRHRPQKSADIEQYPCVMFHVHLREF